MSATPAAPDASAWIALGMLGKARGLRGDLWLRPYNEATEALEAGVVVRLTLRDGTRRIAPIEALEPQGIGFVAHFVGVDDRDAAEALVGATVALQRKDFPPLAAGEYYHCDLPGLRVVALDGADVGTVLRVEAYPTLDALVVATEKGELEVPITGDIVRSLDLDARVAVVDPSLLED